MKSIRQRKEADLKGTEKMTEDKKLSLPASGYQIIEKMLRAYSVAADKESSLDDISKSTGLERTHASKNHPFLRSLRIVVGGKLKKLTPSGSNLALAINLEIEQDIAREWKRVFLTEPAMKPVLDMLRVQKKLELKELRKQISKSLRLTKANLTGINTLIEILEKSSILVKRDDGKLEFVEGESSDPTPEMKIDAVKSVTGKKGLKEPESQRDHSPTVEPVQVVNPALHIDIQIHISADATNEQIDQIFKSMADHLPLYRK